MPQADPAWLAQLEKLSLAAADPAWLAKLEKLSLATADPAWLAQLEKLSLATDKLLAEMPPLTPELFGGTWNERVAEAVERLERTGADVDAETDPHRAVEALDKDAATVQEAAPDEAQERVNTRLSWLRVSQGFVWLKNVYVWGKMLSEIFGVEIPDLSAAFQELLQELQPDRPTVPALDLPTTREIEPIANPKPPSEAAS